MFAHGFNFFDKIIDPIRRSSTNYILLGGDFNFPLTEVEKAGIGSEAMRAKGIIVLVKSNYLVKNIETKQLKLAKRNSAAIVLVFKAGTFLY